MLSVKLLILMSYPCCRIGGVTLNALSLMFPTMYRLIPTTVKTTFIRKYYIKNLKIPYG
ncbi:hypothetical protein SAMN06265379_10546 [Saccharicrinis carchari]|uniref:Uncharacterized protein n=1 Tax=Saccharicrinis carchari TaxID=1168039 RepID=A0A521DCF7_SACCC|nr:hypothetical protein SAMN06265379_10546 [Saccharicrinis carchari]